MNQAPAQADTKERILDTAERLFAAQGYAGTSLRNIIAGAEVNLAAVHYHFGSKEELLGAVIMRRAAAVNRERLELLDSVERTGATRRPKVEDVVDAFLAPTFRIIRQPGGDVFVRLMARLHAESDILPGIIQQYFGDVVERFRRALEKALPGLPDDERVWRIQFTIGAMAQALRGGPFTGAADPDVVAARLRAFVSAGLKAPLGRKERV